MHRLCAFALVLLAACSPAGLRIDDARYRAPLTPGGPGVAYFAVTSPTADAIVEISSPVAARIEMHATATTAGMTTMKRVDSVALPPGERVAFAPGGLHLMVFGAKPLAPGATFPIQIRLQSGRVEEAALPAANGG